MRGVILYGPPASGKDTITQALHQLDSTYQQFERLKVGNGRTAGYRMSTDQHLEALRASSDVLWENRRYRSTYVVDAPALRQHLGQGVPVLHLGQVGAIDAVRKAFPTVRWTVVALTCPRDLAEQRIVARQTGDTGERLRAWDATEPLTTADIVVDTSAIQPDEAATLIDHTSRRAAAMGQ
ncbi:phosphotransferase-like protein [Micromonospora craniellae]|uniref:Kinase n=1 Tax=Micromonospora craniellae TaxID=2294034 RepID=A0A372G6M1_9ACTN|nr:AAA family ATPase [Micromonospora craniellae]QOC90251.1 AAA family ATPase [Micromonospora craniellae]RFS48360.1 kinase [Micromonospora craniellae]